MGEEKKAPPKPIEFPKVKVRFKDIFNLKEIYIVMYAWLKDNQWKDKTTGKDVEFMEEFFLEKTGPTGAKDQRFYWEVEKKRTEYIKFSMTISVLTLFLNQTEVMKEGKKIKTNIGDMKIEIVARLHPDFEGAWINHWLFGGLQKIVEKTIFKKEIDDEKEELYKQLYKFQSEIKKYLKLQQFTTSETEFYPEKKV